MKKFLTALTTIFFITPIIFAAPELVDQTLALVNGEPVLASEFNSYFQPLVDMYKKITPAKEQTEQEIKKMKDIILDDKIIELLLQQEAKKQKIKVSKKEIQDYIDNLKKMFKNETNFNLYLKKTNTTFADFEKRSEKEILVTKLLDKVVTPNVKTPTEAELKVFYNKVITKIKNKNTDIPNTTSLSNEDDFITLSANIIKKKFSEQIRMRYIFIKCPKNANAFNINTATEKVATVKRELQKKDFVDVVKQYSDYKSRDGDFGLKSIDEIPSDFIKVVSNLNVGDYSKEPIKTDKGYYFIKIEEKRASRNINFDDAKNNLAEKLYQYNYAKFFENYVNKLKAKANIKINKTW